MTMVDGFCPEDRRSHDLPRLGPRRPRRVNRCDLSLTPVGCTLTTTHHLPASRRQRTSTNSTSTTSSSRPPRSGASSEPITAGSSASSTTHTRCRRSTSPGFPTSSPPCSYLATRPAQPFTTAETLLGTYPDTSVVPPVSWRLPRSGANIVTPSNAAPSPLAPAVHHRPYRRAVHVGRQHLRLLNRRDREHAAATLHPAPADRPALLRHARAELARHRRVTGIYVLPGAWQK
jgi:hypothetical protein